MALPHETDSQRWKDRFRAPEIVLACIAYGSPDRGLLSVKLRDTYQLYAWQILSGEVTALTDLPGGVLMGQILSDGERVVYLHDEGGSELGHFVCSPFAGGTAQDLTPDLPAYSSSGIAVASQSNALALGINHAGRFTTYVWPDLDCGDPAERYLMHESEHLSGWPVLSGDGSLAAILTSEKSAGPRSSLLVVDTQRQEQIAALFDGPDNSVEAIAFSPQPGDARLLAQTDRSGQIRPLIWDPLTGARQDLALPKLEGDGVPLDWSPDAESVLLMQVSRGKQQLHRLELETETLHTLDTPAGAFGHGGGAFGQEAFFLPDGRLLALYQNAQHPVRIVELDPQTGAPVSEVLRLDDAPSGQPWREVTFPSADGVQVQAWIALPEGGEPPYPTLLHMHGGPTSVRTDEFDAEGQAWVDHRYAFLSINYRGSTTFGKAFKEAIIGQIGKLEIDDVLAARAWAVAEGLADPARIFLTGYSYGGYLTLLALGAAPNLWAGGMALAAISDWAQTYALTSTIMQGVGRAFFLGTPEEKLEAYAAASPITYVDAYQAPVLIIQGTNDTRTPAEPIRDFERALRERDKPVAVHWFEAGHLGPTTDQWIAFMERMIEFADSHWG